MTRWTDTLPEVGAHDDPRGHGEMAMQYLAWALQDERAGRREALLREVRYAAAHVLAWRLSLPKDQRGKRVWTHSASDRHLIRSAMHEVLRADGSTTRTGDRALALRHAEAALRTLGKRLQAEVSADPEPTAVPASAPASDDDRDVLNVEVHCPGCTCPIERDTADILARWERERVAALIRSRVTAIDALFNHPHPIAMWVSGAKWAASVAETGEPQ